MLFWGKVVGFVMGFLLRGPIGAVIGFMAGHFFDQGVRANVISNQQASMIQQVFLESTFLMMGYLSKLEGSVTKATIQAAEAQIARLRLNKKQRLLAIDLFGLGKKEDFNPEYSLNKLREACARYPELLQTFIQIQIEVQNFSHALSRQKKHVLKQWCLAFGLPIDHFPLLREQADKRSQANRGQGHATSTKTANIGSYAVLGLKQDASQQEIKLAYRKLMSQYHPDKLVSKGLPTELLKFAKEKTQAIQSAYEDICKERGF